MKLSNQDTDFGGYLLNAASRWPDKIALRFGEATWTYGALQDAVIAAKARLFARGIAEGTRVLILLDNSPDYLVAQFALAQLGAVFVTPNPSWTDRELHEAASVSDATAAIPDRRFANVASSLNPAIPVNELREGPSAATDTLGVDPKLPLYIPFSSGTTGVPKAVVHTGASLCGGVEQLRLHLGLTADDKVQIALPLCHIFGATMVAAVISVGAELTLFRRFDLDESLRNIRRARVTICPIAGSVAYQLAQRTDLAPSDFASLRFFMWGGSAVPADLAATITDRTGVGFLCSYGMTEAMMVAFNPVERPHEWRLDSPGYATAGTELRLRASGELEVRGPSVALGYAQGSNVAFSDGGWFRTGDLATLAADGRLTIVDRLKDMIKVSGFQVSPVEVEQVLLTHPGVEDVGVVESSDIRTGEAPHAFVVSSSTQVSADELSTWAATRLAKYKLPKAYHFVAELPRTSGGKLRRAELRAAATEDC